ncbi:MAG: B12-binding domain-containing radical SAM protein [Nitrospinales bacterium]
MKTLLVFPCQWYPTQPYLSTPYLTSYLRSKGWDVRQRDFNIESYDRFLSRPCLEQAVARIGNRISGLRARPSLTIREKSLMDVLATGLRLAEKIVSQVDEAKTVMRTPERFFDFGDYRQADMVIKSALKLISDAYAPCLLTLSTFESGIGAEESSRKARAAARDEEANPFIWLYENHLLQTERWEDYGLVGISIVGISQIIPGLTLARLLKKRYPHLHITLGGPIFSVVGSQLEKRSEFFEDFCHSIVTFEGEEPLHQLLTALENGASLADKPNLLYLENGAVRHNTRRVELRFEELPSPTFDGLPLDLYLSPYPILPVLQSRGCYWGKCTFCTHSYVYGHRYGKQRTHRMVDELEAHAAKYNARYFTFSDEAVSPHSLNDVSDTILERGTDLRALALLKFEKVMDEQLFRKMKRAGFIFLMFGLESANDRVLSLIEKGTCREVEQESLRKSREAGIWNHIFLFFGFPTETRQEAMDTLGFIRENMDNIHSLAPGVFLLNRDSSIYRFPERYAITRIIEDPEADIAMNLDFAIDVGMKREEAVELNARCIKMAEESFPSIQLWGVMPREHFLLYLDRFGIEGLMGGATAAAQHPKEMIRL